MRTTSTAADHTGAPSRARAFVRRLRRGDQIAYLITFIFAATIFLITALLFYELYSDAALTRNVRARVRDCAAWASS